MKYIQNSDCSLNYRKHARNHIGSFCKNGLEKQKLCKKSYSYAINNKCRWLLKCRQDRINKDNAMAQTHPKQKQCERTRAWTFSHCGH